MTKLQRIAQAVIDHNPDTRVYDHVLIGIDKALDKSPTGITWRDIQKMAKLVVKKKSV